MKKHKVLIVGGGFGGVKTAQSLSNQTNFDVTLLSDRENFRYYPTLYHVATGGRYANASIPLNHLLKASNINLAKGEAVKLDRENKIIVTRDGKKFAYDTLVLALGVVTNYFGIKGLKENSFSIKTPEDASEFKAHLHEHLLSKHPEDSHYVIIGGGPTGVELAGALPHYLQAVMKKHNIKSPKRKIYLVEAAPRLLPRSPKLTSKVVRRHLRKLGVIVQTGKVVQGATADGLSVSGRSLKSHTVVWTAGVTNHPFFSDNKFELSDRKRVVVDDYLRTEKDIYVIGDNADTPYSGLAQTALRDGAFVAKNLKCLVAENPPVSYKPKRPIVVISVGPRWASVEWGKLQLFGWIGYLMREAGDWVGFHDYEPWQKATSQWLTGFGEEENCQVCAVADSKKA